MKNNQEISKLQNYKIVKSNDLIQKARFDLTVQEQKVILYLISKIKPEDIDFEEQAFEITEFCKVCGLELRNGKNYKNIKDAIQTLANKSVWLAIDNNTTSLVRWINKAWIVSNSGTIRIRLDEDMKPYLLQIQKNYTAYELLYILAMKSQYSIRLYELLRSYEYQHTKIFDIDELKKLLSVENYELYGDFKRRVLEIATREINELSDLTTKYDPIKDGRRVAKIEFTMKIKKNLNDRMKMWSNIDKVINPDQISLFEVLS